jgi:hypothetical protein
MLAYHSDPKIKAKYLRRVRAHRAADQLIQGTGWDDVLNRGCAVGCTLRSYDHSRYPIELGIPEEIAHLEDRLFELQPKPMAQEWPERFMRAIAPGADLSRVWSEWAIWMLVDESHGVIRRATGFPDCETAIRSVAALLKNGGTLNQFDSADRFAYCAARDVQRDGDRPCRVAEAACDAAASVAAVANYGPADAADAADHAATAYGPRRARWVTAACDKLIALLAAAPVTA